MASRKGTGRFGVEEECQRSCSSSSSHRARGAQGSSHISHSRSVWRESSTNRHLPHLKRRIRTQPSPRLLRGGQSLYTLFVICCLLLLLILSTPTEASSIRKQQPESSNNSGDTSPTNPVNLQDPVIPQPPTVVENVVPTSIEEKQEEEDADNSTEEESSTTSSDQKQQQMHPGTAPVVAPSVVPPKRPVTPVRLHQEDLQQDFLDWCAAAGIQTNLTIQMFDYTDYMKVQMKVMANGNHQYTNARDDVMYNDEDDEYIPPQVNDDADDDDANHLQVRGLAAMHDIVEGEVVISIPFTSMIAVPTTIDEDPILNTVMGPTARKLHGWDDDEFYELGLLTVALLYHRNLGKASPLYHYISILETARTDHFPFLWDAHKLKHEATEGVRRYSRAISKDIDEVYDTVLGALRTEFPVLFDTDVYSLDNFLWAFALLHSRLWYLPIPDFKPKKKPAKGETENRAPQMGIGDQVPPASLPTEEWMQEQGDTDEDDLPAESHSFLAPVADLLNFGPPCTRGTYNKEARAFELVATCSFFKGQEVTYWYSDDCDDIIIANYGFTHPMVPACPTMEDLQQQIEAWKKRSQHLETEIGNAYNDLDEMERELEGAQSILTSCNCDGSRTLKKNSSSSKSRKTSAPPAHDHIRGSTTSQKSDHERGRGTRHKAWNHQKSDVGL